MTTSCGLKSCAIQKILPIDRGLESIPITSALTATKAFQTAAAEFALAGHQLEAELGIDGVTRLRAACHRKTSKFDSVDAARAHLAHIGGMP